MNWFFILGYGVKLTNESNEISYRFADTNRRAYAPAIVAIDS